MAGLKLFLQHVYVLHSLLLVCIQVCVPEVPQRNHSLGLVSNEVRVPGADTGGGRIIVP